MLTEGGIMHLNDDSLMHVWTVSNLTGDRQSVHQIISLADGGMIYVTLHHAAQIYDFSYWYH